MIAEAIAKIQQITLLGTNPQSATVGDYVVLPNGTVTDLTPIAEKRLSRPRRLEQRVLFEDVESFLHYYAQFQGGVLFATMDPQLACVKAIFDYHDKDGGNWCKHVARFKPVQTLPWKQWLEYNGAKMSQQEFAVFMEDHAMDVHSPDPATMLEVARELEVKRDVQFAGGTRTTDGNTVLQYAEETTTRVGKGQIAFPSEFRFFLKTHQGFGAMSVNARLRYRLQDGKVTLWYDLVKPHEVLERVMTEALDKIEAATGQKIMLGQLGVE